MGGGGGKGETAIVDSLTVALTTENDGKNRMSKMEKNCMKNLRESTQEWKKLSH